MENLGVVLVAAGAGERFGGPKASAELDGRPLVECAAALFQGYADRVVVLRDEDLDRFELAGWKRVAGGARRRDSVAAGVAALDDATRRVLVHDAARPLAPADLVERVAAAPGPAVVPGIPVADTIKEVDGETVRATLDRSRLVAVQTPQAFDREVLERALASSDSDATDEASLVEALGVEVRVVAGNPANFKVTTPLDLLLAEALRRQKPTP
ncbi:MAG: IspD/TarI family cytidylyltransferase [Planctomycetota bacterium]|jgi:2-C-methyl-D-erythritol 4-phosphate cytidylyltransferase